MATPPPARTERCGPKKKTSRKPTENAEVQEVKDLERRLFELADRNNSGSIQFEEFADQHRMLIHLLGGQMMNSGSFAKTSTRDLEREFRKRDSDQSLCLDFEEYSQYMDSIHTMLGHRSFVQACTELLEEAQAKDEHHEAGFDAVASDLLLDKLRTVSTLRGHHGNVVEQLLEKRANPNFADSEGNSVLLYASDKAGVDLVARLLRARADPSRSNRQADCAILRAARARSMDVVRLLLLPGEGGREAGAEALESLPASIELVRTMPEAAERDVRELLAKRADVNYRDEGGWTALISAVFWGKRDCAEAILKHHQLSPNTVRLKVDAPNSHGLSPLHIAARKGRDELIPLLLSSRCNPDLRDIDGWTPLHHATFNGMDASVQLLLRAHADARIQGKIGLTPWMVSMLPTHAGTLQAATVKLIDPNEHVNFSKQIIPILSNPSLRPYEKLEELYGLPGVSYVAANLRLYEHFFSVRTGPNKVRLTKMWDGLARDLLLRLRSGETDVAPHSGVCLDEEEQQEQARRWHEQKVFLQHWLRETMGPVPSHEWQHDSREAYREELERAVADELAGFSQELTEVYARLQAEEHGNTLCSIAANEVLRPEYTTQLGAHPILTWLDTLDVVAAFHSLHSVKALGASRDLNDALQSFVDLVCTNSDFESGASFWSNVYKLWLHHYGQMAQQDFQRKVSAIVSRFNERYDSEGLTASCRPGPVKSYERMKAKEPALGAVSSATNAGRWVASRVLDVVRTSVTVSTPRAAVILLDEFFRPLDIKEDRAVLVQVVNNFNKTAETAHGYRDLVLNLSFDGGMRSTNSGCGASSKDVHLALVGEVRIVLEEFLSVKKRMHLITQYAAGVFDHKLPSLDKRRGKGGAQSTQGYGG